MYKSPTIGMHYGDPAPDAVIATVQEVAEYEATLANINMAFTLTAAVQTHLDSTARADGWDSIYTASLRAAFPGPWQAKGVAYATWMDSCWMKCHDVQAAVAAGIRPIPTVTELVAELPSLVLP